MSRSNDPGHYFQTTDALATTERKAAKSRNKHGDPIELSSKVLAAIADPSNDNAVYVAEAVGEIRRVDLESRKVSKIFDQSAAPLTCLTICPITKTLFTGSWDKVIYAIPLDDPSSVRKLSGHSDFLKCVLATSLKGKPILISGSADATIIVWDIESGKQLYKLKGHNKALADLTLDPLSLPTGSNTPGDSLALFSSSSDREIRRWHISLESASELSESLEKPIRAHDTSVYRLHWDSEGDLWTASADKTVKHLVRSRDWEADTTLQHPDFVRDVVVFEDLGLVVTACRDEEVRVWEISSGKLVCTYTGHYEEVTALVAVGGREVVSVSIDGTVRQWSLERKAMLEFEEELKKEEVSGESAENEKKAAGSMLTAEEEAELAELMSDDDE
ncbi:Putative WD40/YVTN repeat-like-containing domain superfamily [Septoria linicola]|uniref:WD40/YVTN repeat-like-containing domain superfamily n=1 Tax=Septoria linicola TaxID=215465 RepID=A0A9Q9AV24_9PEZI|nr:Putative WD40/YVTN repeat-like-containing domain superfamily [Septoria linicola]